MDTSNKPSEFVSTIKADSAAKAIGPYSVGKIVQPGVAMIYLSGQIGLVKEVCNHIAYFLKTGELVSEDVAEQAK